MMSLRSCDRLAEGRADTNCGRDRAKGQIKATGTTRQVRDHNDGDDPENASADAVEQLDANQQEGIVGESVKYATNRQYPETCKEQGFSTPYVRPLARLRSNKCDRELGRHDA